LGVDVVLLRPFNPGGETGATFHTVAPGITAAEAVMSLWPDGLPFRPRLFDGEVEEGRELGPDDAAVAVLRPGDRLIVADLPRGIEWAVLAWQLAISVALSAAVYLLTPKPKTPKGEDDKGSGTTALAAQRNELRPGARVPELLGTVRSYPDLFLPPWDTWRQRTQIVDQWFVIGAGSYRLTDFQLGETPCDAIPGCTVTTYGPGETLPGEVQVVRAAPEVSGYNLVTEEEYIELPTAGIMFVAPDTLQSPEELPVNVGSIISISGSVRNDGAFRIMAAPNAGAAAGPYTYTVSAGQGGQTLVNEGPVNPAIAEYTEYREHDEKFRFGFIGGLPTTSGIYSDDRNFKNWAKVGDLFVITDAGTMSIYRVMSIGDAAFVGSYCQLENMDGTPPRIPTGERRIKLEAFRLVSQTGGGTGATPGTPGSQRPWSEWIVAPLENADRLYLDFAFPQGIAYYDEGKRRSFSITVAVEIRPYGATAAVPFTRSFTYRGSVTHPLRFTEEITLADIGLLTSRVEVRVRRTSDWKIDDSKHQYLQQSEWARFAAARRLTQRAYEDVTLVSVRMVNTRSAGRLGEAALNCIATRVLPTWDAATGWSAPVPTNRWADAFVARLKSTNGANRSDAQIDLAGIYDVQEELDKLDRGEGGDISLALDQFQDVDTELLQIAQLARCTVYRLGSVICVTRDQPGPASALFNARNKTAEGESVSMKLTNDSDYDCVAVPWIDAKSGFKQREYRYPENSPAVNPLTVGPAVANWAQAYRRAVYEWNRITLRREVMQVTVTEEGGLLVPGQIINVADDLTTLVQAAGEVIEVNAAATVLLLDRPLDTKPATRPDTLMLRSLTATTVDSVPISGISGDGRTVTLARPAAFEVRGRSDATGTLFAAYRGSEAVVRQWILNSATKDGLSAALTLSNYDPAVYAGDTARLPAKPVLVP
jgi:hypothetical protein